MVAVELTKEAENYLVQGKLDEAISCYQKVISLDPNIAENYRHLASIWTKKGNSEAAAECWYQALTLDPNWATADEHITLGNTLVAQGKLDKAIICYNKSIELNPKIAIAYHNLGEILTSKNQWEEAISNYRKAIHLNPDSSAASHCGLGKAFAGKGQLEESISCYKQAIEIEPQKANYFYNLADVLAKNGELDAAIASYQKAIGLQSDIWQFYEELGNVLSKKGLFNEAADAYLSAVNLSSEALLSYHHLGQTLLLMRRFDEAIALCRRAIELTPNSPWPYTQLGNALVEQGELDTALVCYQTAAQLRGWTQCAERKYEFTRDWFTHNIPIWEKHLKHLAGVPGINILEIGSFQGMSACWFLDNILTHVSAKITCIEPSFQYQFDENIAKTGAGEKVTKLAEMSYDCLGRLPENSFDLIYIDGCHQATSVLEDALLSWNLAKIGSIIIFDDYEWRDPETKVQITKIGIDIFISLFQNQIEFLHKGYQIIIKKIGDRLVEPGLSFQAYQNLGDRLATKELLELEQAEIAYGKAIKNLPNQGSAYHKLAKLLHDREEFERAADAYRRAVERDPNVSWSYHNLGDVLLKLEKWEEASVAYRRAIELKPDFHWSYNNLGISLSQQEKWEEAIPAYRRAIELNPDFFGSHHHLGYALIKQEKWEEAVAAYLRAIELNPDFSWSYQNLGDVLIKQEKWDEAAAAYRRVVELNPEASWCCQSLGEILEKQQKWDEAAAAYRRGTELQSDNPWLYKKLGDVLQKLELWDEAIAIYKDGIGVDLQAYFCYEGVGLCLLEKQDWEGAIASFIQALKIKPDLLEVYHKIGYALEQQGELEKSEWGCCEYQMLPLKVLKKYCDFNENLTVTSESEPSINYISIFPADEISLLPSKSLDSNPIFSSGQYYSPKTFVAVVPEGRAWADVITTAVITSENKLVTDLSTGCAELVLSSDRLAPIEYIDGTVAFLSVRWGGAAYYHWMFDVIPRFELLRRSGIDIDAIDKFIVNGTEHSYEKETLKTLGIPETKIIESRCGLHIQAKNLVIPSNCYQGISQISKWGCEFIKKEFSPENGTQTIEKWKRIYISRNLASYRKVVNEEELLNFLEPWGFESVKLETMSVAEQASCLASAEVVVAPHGAGLTNIVFCSPGTKIIEVFSPTYLPSCYWILSNVGGLEHYYLIGDLLNNSDSTLPIHKDIKVNLELLENLIRTYAII
ncbi:MAG TPA: tetratricopeptide repeat protein [Kamptonema sp.]|nr:tetratricopeptide repeat protein [Kamptonema sp.]